MPAVFGPAEDSHPGSDFRKSMSSAHLSGLSKPPRIDLHQGDRPFRQRSPLQRRSLPKTSTPTPGHHMDHRKDCRLNRDRDSRDRVQQSDDLRQNFCELSHATMLREDRPFASPMAAGIAESDPSRNNEMQVPCMT